MRAIDTVGKTWSDETDTSIISIVVIVVGQGISLLSLMCTSRAAIVASCHDVDGN